MRFASAARSGTLVRGTHVDDSKLHADEDAAPADPRGVEVRVRTCAVVQQHVRDLDQRVDVWSETGVELAADGSRQRVAARQRGVGRRAKGRARPMADTPNGSAAWPFPMMVRVCNAIVDLAVILTFARDAVLMVPCS